MADEQAQVLARDGNVAVVLLPGRAFPGVHIQGDTFAEIQRQLSDAAVRLRRAGGDSEALNDLDHVVEEMDQLLRRYETVLAEHGLPRPYSRERAS